MSEGNSVSWETHLMLSDEFFASRREEEKILADAYFEALLEAAAEREGEKR